jgi:hypothetical protein
MEQSNIIDLRNWLGELNEAFGWDATTTDEGDWSFRTDAQVDVLVEPDPELESRRMVFTAVVGKIDAHTPRTLLLTLLAFNATAGAPAAPVIAYRPGSRAVTVCATVMGTPETWTGANFVEALNTFCELANELAAGFKTGDIDFLLAAPADDQSTPGMAFA